MRLLSTLAHEHLFRKLGSVSALSESETHALLELPLTLRNYPPHADLVRFGDKPIECALLLEGIACSYKLTSEGRRQILSLFVPGDMPDLQSLFLEAMDYSVAAITASTVAFVPHEALRQVLQTNPSLVGVFWRQTLLDGAISREWLVSLGRRTAYSRIAHLLCELRVRFRDAGIGEEEGYTLPLTQSEIGDALGLSTVHTNRALQSLRYDGLIQTRGRYVAVPDWNALARAGEFDSTYLHRRG